MFDGKDSETDDIVIKMLFSFIFLHFLGNQTEVGFHSECLITWECYRWKF